jgi:hypothetical protein
MVFNFSGGFQHRAKWNSQGDEGRHSGSHHGKNIEVMPPQFTPHPADPRWVERGAGGGIVWKAPQAEGEVVPGGAWRFLDALHRSAGRTCHWYVLCSTLPPNPANLQSLSKMIDSCGFQVRPQLEEDRGACPHKDYGTGNSEFRLDQHTSWLHVFNTCM